MGEASMRPRHKAAENRNALSTFAPATMGLQ